MSDRSSREYRTVTELLPSINNLLATSGILPWFAQKLLSGAFIAAEKCTYITSNTGDDQHTKASSLMQSVMSQIELDANKYYRFVAILEEQPSFQNLVGQLSHTLGKSVISYQGDDVSIVFVSY